MTSTKQMKKPKWYKTEFRQMTLPSQHNGQTQQEWTCKKRPKKN